MRLRRSLEKVSWGMPPERFGESDWHGLLDGYRQPSGKSELARRWQFLRFLYLFAVYLAAPAISLIYLWRGIWDRSYWEHFSERFGFGPRPPPGGAWLHAVSVGEVQACAALVNALHRRHPQLPLTVTSFTPTGVARARALFGDIAQVRYLPFDLPGLGGALL